MVPVVVGVVMKTFKRICIQDWEVTDSEGNRCEVLRGNEYITSPEHDDGTCTVFTTYWVRVPVTHFAGEQVFTQ